MTHDLRALKRQLGAGGALFCYSGGLPQAMIEALGDPYGIWTHEVDRYIVMPAQATGYKIGMIKILELRQLAMDELGDLFDIKEFHDVVLGSGGVPLGLLERAVRDYIDDVLGS